MHLRSSASTTAGTTSFVPNSQVETLTSGQGSALVGAAMTPAKMAAYRALLETRKLQAKMQQLKHNAQIRALALTEAAAKAQATGREALPSIAVGKDLNSRGFAPQLCEVADVADKLLDARQGRIPSGADALDNGNPLLIAQLNKIRLSASL